MTPQSCSCNGTIIFKSKSIFEVSCNQKIIRCILAPQLERQLINNSQSEPKWLAIGDQVRISCKDEINYQIEEVFARHSVLARRSASAKDFGHEEEQVIAVNVDQLVAVFAISQPEINWNLLDRYLVLAESAELNALICLTKLDQLALIPDQSRREIFSRLEDYHGLGYEIVLTSSTTLDGIEKLKQHLSGKLSILLGKSGVGKTSLLNCLLPGFRDRVNSVNPVTGKGRHTTSALSLLSMDQNSGLIDTPGTREFGLWNLNSDDLAYYFPEMRPFLGKCKFRLGCQHSEEPGCAIRQGVMAGEISPYRYKSYLKLKEEEK